MDEMIRIELEDKAEGYDRMDTFLKTRITEVANMIAGLDELDQDPKTEAGNAIVTRLAKRTDELTRLQNLRDILEGNRYFDPKDEPDYNKSVFPGPWKCLKKEILA